MPSCPKAPSSICILRLSAIGDVCHAIATVQAIQKKYPQAKISWVVGKIEHQLLNDLPNIEFFVLDKKAGIGGYFKLYQQLKNRRFDILLQMQLSFRASLTSLCIKAKQKWGFNKQQAKEGQWLFTNHRIPFLKQPHVADGMLAFAKAIGVDENYQLSWKLPITQELIEWQQELTQYGKYIVIAPAASNPNRNWLADRYAGFANYVHQKGYCVVLCGSPSSAEVLLAEQIQKDCDFPLINLVGKSSLKQLMMVIKNAQMVLAPDTGPVHISVMCNTPVIGLYAHSNPKRTGPYHFQEYVVSCYEELLKQQTGLTSEQQAWGKRVKGENLMALISLQSVLKSFDKMEQDFNLSSS